LRIPSTSLVERESPDFEFAHGGKTIGLEVTRAIYQEFLRGMKLVCPEAIADITDLRDRDKRRSNEEIQQAMCPRPEAPWQPIEEGISHCKARIQNALMPKLDKLNGPNWQAFGENWLLICDEQPLLVYTCGVDSAQSHLRALLAEQPRQARYFDAAFVSSDPYLFTWREGKLTLARIHDDGDKGEAQDWEQLVNQAQRESNHDNGEKVEAQE
jgi:hypothetical protein